nr:unnamed protein product [Spirometra erinaceieuropaei]
MAAEAKLTVGTTKQEATLSLPPPSSRRPTGQTGRGQPAETNAATRSRTGALQGGYRCTQRDPLFLTRPIGRGGSRLRLLLKRPSQNRRDAGVAFAIRNDIVGLLSSLPQGINDRLMSLHLPLRGGKLVTIISVHAPLIVRTARHGTGFTRACTSFRRLYGRRLSLLSLVTSTSMSAQAMVPGEKCWISPESPTATTMASFSYKTALNAAASF